MSTITLPVAPVPKPRMTRRDKWLSPARPRVARYRAFCDHLRLEANLHGVEIGGRLRVVFHVEMPPSWSKRKRAQLAGQPHQQRPDVDNFAKGFVDALCPDDDSHIYDLHAVKLWSPAAGKIEILESEAK